ncbi:MAG: mannose-1-phosphate guanylyltransferase [Cyanobacteria bacterium QS_8_64_29]|nr:MAG: mannose-1-phosphate guanylyltransferase [Cyanobacteria bacterium QS_8_64_29]
MRAVLMAGGSGTRLRPLTCDLPKPMVPVLNRPIAEHIIRLLKRHGVEEIVATLHYIPDAIRDYFQDGSEFGVSMTYAIEQDQALGTAGSVKNISNLLDESFIVISGDSITDFDLSAALAFHRQKQSKATLVLARVPNPVDFGVVITDSDYRINRFLEKPASSEIFSDTVNTGTYILEPEVLDYLPEGEESDFSTDLFPQLLAQGDPMYGFIADGYWCDVGHLNAYRESQYDALNGQVALEFDYPQREAGLWVGERTAIDPSAQIEGPVAIGNNCRIGPNVKIGAGTVLGDDVTVGAEADLKHPVVWSGATIGEQASLRACTIARGCRVGRRAQVLEGATVGTLSTVGEEALIASNVRVWPNKRIESGAILNISLIWGNMAQRNLFGQQGVTGIANIDITPEFAVKLGAAYGSTLPPGASVTVSRDQRSVSRMVTRSLVSGLMSAGVNIQNLEATAVPIARTLVPQLGVWGGIHVRLHPSRTDSMLLEFFDASGIDLPKAKEKKLEGTYFKEDLRRVQIPDIGNMTYPSQILDAYSRGFEANLNVEAVRNSRAKVVIDYAYAVSGAVLPRLMAKFGCDAVVLNATLSQTALSAQERETLLGQLGQVVGALSATFGAQVAANGEQLTLVDETGTPIRGELLTALMVETLLASHPRRTVVVPVHAASTVERIAERHGGNVVRTKANPTALMEAIQQRPNAILGGSGETGFIFPQLHPGFDAMFCIAKLIELITVQERSLAEIRKGLPQVCHQSHTMHCPWAVKGSLMRHLVETHAADHLALIDGVKIAHGSGDDWVLVLPDASEPLVHVFANGEDRDWVERILQDYCQRVQDFIEREQAVEVGSA